MIVYKATCIINGKPYIGITKHKLQKRKAQHLNLALYHNSKIIFHKALRKHGEENFTWEIIDEVVDRSDAEIKEIYYIEFYNSLFTNNGYNVAKGYVNPFFKETQKKKEEITPWNKNLKDCYSEETLNRMSISLKKTWQKQGHPLVGFKMSNESKKLMSDKKKGKTYEQICGSKEKADLKKEKYKKTILEKNLNKTHLSDEQLLQMKDDFLNGDKPKYLSNKYDIHNTTVIKKLIKLGITEQQFCENKKSRRKSYKIIDEDTKYQIIELRNKNIPIKQIAAKFKIDPKKISMLLKEWMI